MAVVLVNLLISGGFNMNDLSNISENRNNWRWLLQMLIVLCALSLALPTLHAQTAAELLNWTRTHLDRGNCDDAKETYALYKEKVPQGNADVERRIAECGKEYKNLTFKVGDVTFKMIFVKGGTFQMGSDSGDDDERPVHNVTVSDFYMGEFEVTQALWQEVMGTTVYQQRDKDDPSGPMRGVGVDYPMYYVNHTEAEEFCGRLNQRLRSQLPAGYSFALPTEAEWEYAARGGNKTKTYTYSGSNYLSDVAWYADNSNSTTHAAGSKRANELGLYDMSGNVWEWCTDWYGSYSSSSQTDPRGPSSGSGRVLRGGGWINSATSCRVAYRNVISPSYRIASIGFRLALVHR